MLTRRRQGSISKSLAGACNRGDEGSRFLIVIRQPLFFRIFILSSTILVRILPKEDRGVENGTAFQEALF